MRRRAHYIQDACELYAVALMQELAEERDFAINANSQSKYEAFRAYAEARELSKQDFTTGTYSAYMSNVDEHIPSFVNRIASHFDGPVDFEDVEAEYRNLGKKGDFIIVQLDGEEVSVSLKNYRKTVGSSQVCSGTFNSFIVNFLFESAGVGMAVNPKSGETFRGSSTEERDQALHDIGHGNLVPYMHQLDELNQQIKERFVYSEEWEFLDEDEFDRARKECGEAGASIALEVLQQVDEDVIQDRVLAMTGLDGAEEALMIDPGRSVDSLTSSAYRQLLKDAQAEDTRVVFSKHGQGIRFALQRGSKTVLSAHVPFTINKNGAWISGEPYEGTRYHEKEGVELAYGQRRPKKSKELATSVNTWVDFDEAGIFG